MRVQVESSWARRIRCAAAVLGLAVGLTVGLWSGSASAATSGRTVFSKGLGSVLPTGAGIAEVSIGCPATAPGACRGSVVLVPRGDTARTLGSRALASAQFRLARGADADLKLRLSGPARRALSHGPLYVIAVLRGAGSRSPVNVIAQRPAALASERPFKAPPQAPRASDAYECPIQGVDAQCMDFSWSWKIPAGHYLKMNSFSCPADMPRVAQGRQLLVEIGAGVVTEFRGKLEASAGDGTGYGAFNQAIVKTTHGGTDAISFFNMLGWLQGHLERNSIWAPLFRDGSFSLKVTCTSATDTDAAWIDDGNSVESAISGPTLFFPW
jgi:hypothetical protein